MTQQTPDIDAFKAMNASVVDEFRANGGKVGGQFNGIPCPKTATVRPSGTRKGLRLKPSKQAIAEFVRKGRYAWMGSWRRI